MTDITYISTLRGRLDLVVVLDLNLSVVVRRSMKPTIANELVLSALTVGVWLHKPIHELIVHSDQGSKYGIDDWGRICDTNTLLSSKCRLGNY